MLGINHAYTKNRILVLISLKKKRKKESKPIKRHEKQLKIRDFWSGLFSFCSILFSHLLLPKVINIENKTN